jgi:hypothetical protein
MVATRSHMIGPIISSLPNAIGTLAFESYAFVAIWRKDSESSPVFTAQCHVESLPSTYSDCLKDKRPVTTFIQVRQLDAMLQTNEVVVLQYSLGHVSKQEQRFCTSYILAGRMVARMHLPSH